MGYEAGIVVKEGIVAGIQLGALPIFKNRHGQNLLQSLIKANILELPRGEQA
jgi:hypothetical protein